MLNFRGALWRIIPGFVSVVRVEPPFIAMELEGVPQPDP